MVGRPACAASLILIALLAVAWLRADEDAALPAVPLSLVATDARGSSVRSLATTDLEITEGGERREITSVTPRAAGPRVVALLLDEFHVSAGAPTERTREALLAFVDRHVRADDIVFVMKPLDPQTGIEPAASLEEVRQRIVRFDGRRADFAPRSRFEQEYMSSAPAAAARQRAQVVRSALEALALAMRAPQQAARALIVVTEGFPSDQRDRTRAMTLRTTARAAALGTIPIYVIDPSGNGASDRFNDSWRALAAQTGGSLVLGAADLRPPLERIAADLRSQFVVAFRSSGRQDGGFHDIEVKSRRAGAIVRAPSGYWAPFPPSAFGPIAPRTDFAALLTPHTSGLIHPWFRMSPAPDGRTRVTFLWSPRRDSLASAVHFAALTFQGRRVHEAVVEPAVAGAGGDTTFDVVPGPLQVSMAIDRAGKTLDTDVRYVDVPKFEAGKPVIAAVEFIRPRSLPEFTRLQSLQGAVPTDAREFHRQDRLLVRVRAFAGVEQAEVDVVLLNRSGHALLELRELSPVDRASQFELPFARYPRGEYLLHVRATAGTQTTAQLLTVRIIG